MDLFSNVTCDQIAYSALIVLVLREAMIVLLPGRLADTGDK